MVCVRFAAIACACVVPAAGALAFDYDELNDGDLSNDPMFPDQFTADFGSNTIRLQVFDSNAPTGDLDFFTVNLPTNLQIEAIRLIELDANGGDEIAFIGTQIGTVFDIDPQNPDQSQLLGLFLTSQPFVGTDLQPSLAGGVPVVDPLSFWVQQTGPDVTTIGLEIQVGLVPSPGVLTLGGLGALAAFRRRR